MISGFSAHDTDVLHSPMFSLISTLLSLINQLTIYHAAQERKTIGERCQGINFGRKTKDRTIESKVHFEMWSGIEFSWRTRGFLSIPTRYPANSSFHYDLEIRLQLQVLPWSSIFWPHSGISKPSSLFCEESFYCSTAATRFTISFSRLSSQQVSVLVWDTFAVELVVIWRFWKLSSVIAFYGFWSLYLYTAIRIFGCQVKCSTTLWLIRQTAKAF